MQFVSQAQSPRWPGTPNTASFVFMDLPGEVRDLIYSLALVSPSPLIAWSSMSKPKLAEASTVFQQSGVNHRESPQSFDIRDYNQYALPATQAFYNLSLVCRDISKEIVEIFWSHNTFRFMGQWKWCDVFQWLVDLRPMNRNHMKRLEFELRRLQHVMQFSPDHREKILGHSMSTDVQKIENKREIGFSRSKHLILPIPERPYDVIGVVENISPRLEEVIGILAEPGNLTRITMTMLLPYRLVPGYQKWGPEAQPDSWMSIPDTWMSMDLLNVIESCIHTCTGDGRPKIEVLWKCKDKVSLLRENDQFLDECG